MVDLIDETFIAAQPAAVAARLRGEGRAAPFSRDLWPDLNLTVREDRAEAGIRWIASGPLAGSTELWIEPWGDGSLVHIYVRADITRAGSDVQPIAGPARRLARRAERERRRRAWQHKRVMWALKTDLERGRAPGEPAVR